MNLRYVQHGDRLGDPDLVILPGSKTTIPDLLWMERQGLSQAVASAHRRGSAIVGICGGYQMLGDTLYDPDGIESSIGQADGLGLLPLSTTFAGSKETHRVQATVRSEASANGRLLSGAAGESVVGYEIHMGRTVGEGFIPAFAVNDRADAPVTAATALDGALDESGRVMGTYIHGLFHNAGVRRAMLGELARRKGVSLPDGVDVARDREYDRLADWVRSSLRMDLVYDMVGRISVAMSSIHLVLGGIRSGKSAYAERLAAEIANGRPVIYIATGTVIDDEMAERVRRHRQRRPSEWKTVEAPLNPVGALREAGVQSESAPVLLLDSLDGWVSNLLLEHEATPAAELTARTVGAARRFASFVRKLDADAGGGEQRGGTLASGDVIAGSAVPGPAGHSEPGNGGGRGCRHAGGGGDSGADKVGANNYSPLHGPCANLAECMAM